MIRKSKDNKIEFKDDLFGGIGEIKFEHYFLNDEITAKCRLCAKATVPVGAKIGVHRHDNEDEIFIILKGSGICDDGKKETIVNVGDSILTLSGGQHSMENIGDVPLEFLAMVVQY